MKSMRFLLRPINAITDTLFAWFTPGWRRKGHEALGALVRYYNYNRPTINEEQTKKITELITELRSSLLFWKKEATIDATKRANDLGELLKGFRRDVIIELVESFFVIMVIFLGIRTYYLQPFRIPTGSMQPTLNGITVNPITPEEIPSAPVRALHAITHGSSYVNIKIDSPKKIVGFRTEQYWLIFTRTAIIFNDRSVEYVPCASGALIEYLGKRNMLVSANESRMLQPGETLICARLDAGDMVVVNRMAYHFRKPERGETFVFDTRGINTKLSDENLDQQDASHYIKRLCGVPGDTLSIDSPQLLINGQPATEWTIQRVAACKPPYNATGYNYPSAPKVSIPTKAPDFRASQQEKERYKLIRKEWDTYARYYLSAHKPSILLKKDSAEPILSEYAALGDNTVNSQDSRYWGPVHQFNVLGPASFTIWPFSAHWGLID